jgi:beta-1,4-N-acetylglucosaminyltransferase
MFIYLATLALLALAAALRINTILPKHGAVRNKRKTGNCKLGVFLGSGMCHQFPQFDCLLGYIGGHTTEALALLKSLPFDRYRQRVYLVSEGDAFSERKAIEFENHRETVDPVSTPWWRLVLELTFHRPT